MGNITQWQDLLDSGRDQQFGYDTLDRLDAAIGTYGTLGYLYDATGNRLSLTVDGISETYRYFPSTHRLQQILGSVTDDRHYDAAGNTLQSLIGSYTYDDRNRMTSFDKTGTRASYAYNGKGERIQKRVNGEITRFRYGPAGELLGEYNQHGEAMREYVYLNGAPLAMLTDAITASPTILQQIFVNHVAQAVDLDFPRGQPVVIAGPPTYNGAQGAVVSVNDVTAASASISVREWNYMDGRHAYENISLLSLPPGRYVQADGSIWEIGSFDLSGTRDWHRVPFTGSFTGTPHLFLTQQTLNDGDTTAVRARNVDTDGFEAALFEQERYQNGHVEERVGYLAIYSPTGSGNVNLLGQTLAYQLEQISLNHTWLTVGDQQLLYQEEKSNDSEIGHMDEQVDVLHLGGHLFAQDVSTNGRDTAAIRRKGTTPTDQISADLSGSDLVYLHTDHLGAVVKATDSRQTLVWDAAREPFGERKLSAALIEMPLGFPGQYFDEETGNYYNYYRDYDPTTGRYLQSDPIGLAGGINTYAYVGGNPLYWVDPYGLWQYYGNWCGPNHTGGYDRPWDQLTPQEQQNVLPPQDDLDTCCQTHDQCHADCRTNHPCSENDRQSCFEQCDRTLANCAQGCQSGGYRRDGLEWYMRRSNPRSGPNGPSCRRTGP